MLYGRLVHVGETFNIFSAVNCTKMRSTRTRWKSDSAPPDPLAVIRERGERGKKRVGNREGRKGKKVKGNGGMGGREARERGGRAWRGYLSRGPSS